jgi:hypothetical protein
MGDGLIRTLGLASRMLVRHRILLSAGLSAAAGVILRALVVIPAGNPLFQYIAVGLVRPKTLSRIRRFCSFLLVQSVAMTRAAVKLSG